MTPCQIGLDDASWNRLNLEIRETAVSTFAEKLTQRVLAVDSLTCVGLDPDLARLFPEGEPASARAAADEVVRFNAVIIKATASYASAFKPNLAFYLPLGAEGIRALLETRALIPNDIPVILDAKASDMGNTAERYAEAYLDRWDFDAVTVTAYLGEEGLKPFLRRAGKGVIIIAKTSNSGSADFQDLKLESSGLPLSDQVAVRAVEWDAKYTATVGLVVGATYPEHLERIRGLAPDLPILLPGVGAQGGGVAASVRAGCDRDGRNLLVSAGRSIMYAGTGSETGPAAGRAAQALRNEVNRQRRMLTGTD